MKTNTLRKLTLSGVFAALASLPAGAQDEPRPPRPEGGRGAGGAGGLMRALDANADGKLDQSEIDMAVAALRKLDKDGDGTLTGAEIFGTSAGGGRPGGPRPEGGREGRPRLGPEMFARIDADGDGKISKDEAPDRMKERFDDIDTNGDGFLDKAEQEALLENLRRRFGQGGQRPGGPGRERPDRDAGTGESEKPKRPPLEE